MRRNKTQNVFQNRQKCDVCIAMEYVQKTACSLTLPLHNSFRDNKFFNIMRFVTDLTIFSDGFYYQYNDRN